MKSLQILTIIVLCILCTSCGQRSRGHRAMTRVDSLRRVAAVAAVAHLKEMDSVRDTLIGPSGSSSTGVITRGSALRKDLLSDSVRGIVRSFDKYNAQVNLSLKDSTTIYGVLMSRFCIQDSLHRYMSGTYSHTGHLITFHSEVTADDRHKVQYDLYFDNSKLVYIHERHNFTGDDDEIDMIRDDAYYMSGPVVLYAYRDEGQGQHRRDQMDVMSLSRYYLQGDMAGHVSHLYEQFQSDYAVLLDQPLEMMVYTAPIRIQMPDVPTEKSPPVPGKKGF